MLSATGLGTLQFKVALTDTRLQSVRVSCYICMYVFNGAGGTHFNLKLRYGIALVLHG